MKKINLIWQTTNGGQTDFEFEYITEILFKDIEHDRYFDNGKYQTILDNSVIIYSNDDINISDSFKEYLKKFDDNGYTYYLLHLSDEQLRHNCSYYEKAKHVFRGYFNPNIKSDNVTYIPVGVKSGFVNKNENFDLNQKKFNFSFIGQFKRLDRMEVLEFLKERDDSFFYGIHNWDCPTSLSPRRCSDIYKKTKFTPCPRGWAHPDSFRIMETLEWGCVPIIKKYDNYDYFDKVWGNAPIIKIENWNQLEYYASLSPEEYNDIAISVKEWYDDFKKSLNQKIKDIVSIKEEEISVSVETQANVEIEIETKEENDQPLYDEDEDDFSICITTFSKRFDYLKNLIEQIRSFTEKDILILVNGDYKSPFQNEYRKKVLELCYNFDNIFPIFFPQQRGLAKMWNTGIIHSKTNWNLVLNDDLTIESNNLFEVVSQYIKKQPDLYRINRSYSHFLINKQIIDEINYFDERLLGFGEEDGDIAYRYFEKYNKDVPELNVQNVNNLVINIRDEKIKPGIGKYTKFNRDFALDGENPKYVHDSSGICGLFGAPMKKVIQDEKQYPYEPFFQTYKKKI